MSNQVNLTTTGTPATVTINDLGEITFVHPVVNEPLVSPDGFLDYETVLESLEMGDLGAAEVAGEIILTDASGNTISPGSDALTFVSLTQTETIQGTKTFNSDRIIIDPTDTGTTTQFQLGWFNDLSPADPDSFGFRRVDTGGVISWMNNANFPQIFAGSPTGTGSTFFDATNNRPLFLNVLDTGVDDPGRVTIGIGGLTIEGSSEIAPTNPLSVFRDDTTPILSFEVESDGTLTAGTTTAYETLVTADNDIPNKKYVDDAVAAIPGGGGGTGFIEYKFDNSTSMSNPGNGEFRYNNSNPALVTSIAISDESEAGGDISTILSLVRPGTILYIQEIEDGAAFGIFIVNTVVDNGSWFQLNVSVSDSGTLPDDGKECGVNFISALSSTDNLPEGSTNLYYTEARVNANASVVANTAKVSADGSVNTHSDVNIGSFTPGEVLFINASSEVDTSSSLQLETAGCSIRTVDDTGLDWCNEQVGTSGSAFAILKKSLGTIGGELPLTSGSKIGGWGWIGQDGVTSNPGYVGLEIAGFVTEDQNGTDGGAEMRFLTTPNGTKTNSIRLTIENDGTLNVAAQTDYELKVTADDDIPNKKYVDDHTKSFEFPVCRNAANQGNQFLRRQNGTPTNLCPYTVPFDGTIFAATAEHSPTDTVPGWDLQVNVNGVSVYTLSLTAGNTEVTGNSVSVDVDEGDRISIQMVNQTAVVDYPGGCIFVRARV